MILTEDRIEELQAKGFSDIPLEDFTKILLLDPTESAYTFDGDVENIGPIALELLRKYQAGEKDFLNDERNLKRAIKVYLKKKQGLPKYMNSLGKFPTVKSFIEYFLYGEDPQIPVPQKTYKTDGEYNKNYSSIDKEIFTKIIKLDPTAKLDPDGDPLNVGQIASQLLLRRYMEGETSFLDNEARLKNALGIFIKKREAKELSGNQLNLRNYKTVEDFIDFMIDGKDPGIAASDTQKTVQVEKDPITDIYNKYYNDIDREVFDKIIDMDLDTTDTKIGNFAKSFLLPAYKKGETDFLKDSVKITAAYEYFKTKLAPIGRKLDEFKTVADFISECYKDNALETFPTSSLWASLKKSKEAKDIDFLTSSDKFEVYSPKTPEANVAVNAYGNGWCSGGFESRSIGSARSHFPNYGDRSKGNWVFCLINKEKPQDKDENFQFYTTNNGAEMGYILDGHDRSFGFDLKDHYKKLEYVFAKDETLFPLMYQLDEFNKIPEFKKYAEEHEVNLKTSLEVNTDEDFAELRKSKALQIIKFGPEIKSIPSTICMGLGSLKMVELSEGLEMIGAQAFKNCGSLQKIKFPKSLKKIGSEAFAYCNGLKGSLDIPQNVEYIGTAAFESTSINLKILLPREKQLDLDVQDIQWFIQHAKGKQAIATEGLNEEIDITEEILDENIPADLLRAYRNSTPAVNGIAKHPLSDHNNLNDPQRRSINYHYGKAEYEKLTYEQAFDYLNWRVSYDAETGNISAGSIGSANREDFNNKICNLRLIIDDQLVEYEVRTGNVLYLAYWLEIPTSYFREKHFDFFKGKNGSTTTDVRFATKYADLAKVFIMADAIYKTNEYDLEVDQATRREKRGHDKTYHIDFNRIKYQGTEHNPLSGYQNDGGNDEYHWFSQLDTGDHKKREIASTGKRGKTYIELLNKKKETLRKLVRYKEYLKHLKANNTPDLSDLTPEEYKEKYLKYKELVEQTEKEYKEICAQVIKAKQDLLISYSTVLENVSELINNNSENRLVKIGTKVIDGETIEYQIIHTKVATVYGLQKILSTREFKSKVPGKHSSYSWGSDSRGIFNADDTSKLIPEIVTTCYLRDLYNEMVVQLENLHRRDWQLQLEITELKAKKNTDTSEYEEALETLPTLEKIDAQIEEIKETANAQIEKLNEVLAECPYLQETIDSAVSQVSSKADSDIKEIKDEISNVNDGLFKASEEAVRSIRNSIKDLNAQRAEIKKKLDASSQFNDIQETTKQLDDSLTNLLTFTDRTVSEINMEEPTEEPEIDEYEDIDDELIVDDED